MKACNGSRWRPVLGVLAAGLFACTLTLHGAPGSRSGVSHDGKANMDRSSGYSRMVTGQVGTGAPTIEVVPPVHAYRPQVAAERAGKKLSLLTIRGLDERSAGTIAARTGGPGPGECELDEECDACDPCKVGACVAGACVAPFAAACALCDNGVFCDGLEMCDGLGACVGAEGQVRFECVGGSKDGAMCNPADPDCPDGACLEVKIPVDPCARFTNLICDELLPTGTATDAGGCVAPCDPDAVPDTCNDGKQCNGVEECIPQECVGGTDDGEACTVDGDCDSGVCGGVCRTVTPRPCGVGASCTEPSGVLTCGKGRCCISNTCSRAKWADCAGEWLAVGSSTDTCTAVAGPTLPNAGEDFNCPKYEAGIVEDSTLVERKGPAGEAACQPYNEIGDDYKTVGCTGTQWIEVTTVRFVGGFPEGVGSRMRVTFYDKDGTFIEDVITEPASSGLDVRRTVIFSEKPVVPCEGYISLRPAREFSPDNLVSWWTTSATDVRVGENDSTKGWIDGAEATGLTGWTLAFEIVGNVAAEPVGACCISAAGTCLEKLGWVCEDEGNVFQGNGTSCNVCEGNPFVSCDTSDDCMACAGGTRADLKCGDPACPGGTCTLGLCVGGDNPGGACDCPGSTCDAVGPCIDVPPACTLHACCKGDTGDCAIGFCSTSSTVFNPAGQPCNDWVDHSDCPQEPVAQYCLRVDPVGGDYCPATWDPVLGYGSNCDPNCCEQPVYEGWDTCAEAATVENLLYIAVPAPTATPPTITYTITGDNKQATFGDYTDGTCPAGIFNEDGGTRDRGWWHAFSLDSVSNCSDIRLDFCCTDPIHQPQWSFLYTECAPCGGNVAYTTAQTPIGNSVSPHDRGEPFCREDNLWMTFTRVRNGIYWLPVYTATGGHFGQYQFHITAASCPEAACCKTNGTCALMNEPDCNDIGGYWMGFGNLPSGMSPVVECGNNCDTGSCCTGPGQCLDDDGLGGPMTYAICNAGTPPLGIYKGGALCDFPEPPCPACEIMGTTNCQLQAGAGSANYVGTSDLGVPPTGAIIADDFVPEGGELSRVCVFGVYLDAAGDGPLTDQYQEFDCLWKVPPAEESFRVRIYADSTDPTKPRYPGGLVSEQSLSGSNVTRGPVDGTGWDNWTGIEMQGWTLTLDTVTLTPGNTYWLEVASDRNVCAGGVCEEGTCAGGVRDGEPCDVNSTCYWHWWQTFNEDMANDWTVFGTDDRPDAGMEIGSGYVRGGGKVVDMQWCVGNDAGPLNLQEAPAPPTGACCDCDLVCTNGVSLTDCTTDLAGVWSIAKTCSDQGVCFNEGDNCSGAAGRAANEGGLNCTSPPGEPGALQVFDGVTGFDTTCYTTDGPMAYGGRDNFGSDIWFAYTATCTGELVASMCMSGNGDGGYDSYMAVYHDDAHPYTCPCPGLTPAPPATEIERSDEGCNGLPDEGSGIVDGIIVFPGECYTVRLGGWAEGQSGFGVGRGLVDISCLPSECYPSLTPEPDRLALPPANPISNKIRFLSFIAQDVGHTGIVRVTFVDLPAAYATWEGLEMFVSTPERYCENSGQKKATGSTPPAYGCGSSGGISPPWLWAATLQCDPPDAIDWASYGKVHIFHEGIVPRGLYHVQVADSSCVPDAESSYSAPLEITMAKWGDAVKDCTTNPCGAPDNSASIVDVTALLDKFKNLPGNVAKARGDIEGSPSGDHRVPNLGIDISDVTYCLGAFLGQPYPPPGFPAPRPKPCG